ncbi:ejaculatory bulb-specific protein 3-like [Contarinia nasturtii]|uniref:ejaculatory bulb-specific protein 3-like n=1 Tax=Contarinia nasturtii TaxID=265458 RepID=UPI0012D386E8|nr:ejaculatory bulb-specific protein 3-like [Contarinia nasturtii]
MKYTLIAILVTLAVVAAKPAAETTYTSRFDNIDLDKILNTKRLFDNYFKCLMDQGKCTPDGKELKKLLPDALKTNCAKCTPKQQEGTDRVLRFMINHKPEEWKQLKAKYDPEDEFVKKYREAAKARGIEI